MIELKPCPFCGSENVVFKYYSYLGVNCFSLHYCCPSCNAGVYLVTKSKADSEKEFEALAAEVGNRRAGEKK